MMHDCIRLRSVTPHAAEYIRRWYTAPVTRLCTTWQMAADNASFGEFGVIIARLLLAVGGGLARVPTCTCAIQHLPAEFAPSHRALIVRVLSLLGPGELPVLRGADSTIVQIVLSVLQPGDTAADSWQATRVGHAAAPGAPSSIRSSALSEALSSLRALAWSRFASGSDDRAPSLIELHAPTLEALDCPMWTLGLGDAWNQALATCTRLETLAYANSFAPSAWLGLSQLHTLRGVDLHRVSIGAIAAALPRLHTLEVDSEQPKTTPPASTVSGFFECLLPRLRVFHFSGSWPADDPAIIEPPRPLPLLHELSWKCDDFVSGFSNAQPATLCAPFPTMIAHWLPPTDVTVSEQPARCPLACVRHLRLFSHVPSAPELASVLRAAPELRTLDAGLLFRDGLDCADDPAFDGLIHPRLRSFRVNGPDSLSDAEFDLLRQRHFPRLQELLSGTKAAGSVV